MKVAKRAPHRVHLWDTERAAAWSEADSSAPSEPRGASMPSEDELREAFDGVDSDESGVIDGDEFKILCMQARATPLASNHRGAAARTRRCQR